ncbi:MAG: hypothetical protein WDN06_22650 [Asticcacaulis sp.]
MAQHDPRRQPVRVTPMIFASATALTVGMLLWKVLQPLPGMAQPMDSAAAMALETEAYAEAAARPGYNQPVDVPISVRDGETLTDAVIRAGVTPDEARMAVNILSSSFNVTALKTGLTMEAAIARPSEGSDQPVQLLGLTVRTGPAKQLTLTTARDGSMRLRALEESVRDERRVAIGTIDGSLFTSAAALGATAVADRPGRQAVRPQARLRARHPVGRHLQAGVRPQGHRKRPHGRGRQPALRRNRRQERRRPLLFLPAQGLQRRRVLR